MQLKGLIFIFIRWCVCNAVVGDVNGSVRGVCHSVQGARNHNYGEVVVAMNCMSLYCLCMSIILCVYYTGGVCRL